MAADIHAELQIRQRRARVRKDEDRDRQDERSEHALLTLRLAPRQGAHLALEIRQRLGRA
jgi:hypothetical protein